MHAKMTRDRKKSFIAAIEKTIEELESSNERMNALLTEVISSQKSSMSTESILSSSATTASNDPQDLPRAEVTPSSSPAMVPNETWETAVPEQMTLPIVDPMERVREIQYNSANAFEVSPRKRICHGFSLSY